MKVILCDICRCELAPRDPKKGYGWFSAGGVVVMADDKPARLYHCGQEIHECCTSCVAKTQAMVRIKVPA